MADDPSTTNPTAAPPTGVQPAQTAPTGVKPAEAAVKQLPPPRQPPSPERVAVRRRFLDSMLVAVVLAFAFLISLFSAHNSDFLLHAATGRLIAHGDLRPMTGFDPFAFTSNGAYWANTNWLFDLIVYLFSPYDPQRLGGTILIVLKGLMIAALAGVMLRTAREPGRALWIPVCCVGLAVLALSPGAKLQPVSISFFFLGLTYWLLHLPRQWRAKTQPPRRPFLPYWLIPPLCLLWVNLDGWFLLGPITVALYLGGETLQDLLTSAGASGRRMRGAELQTAGAGRMAPGERRTLLWVLLASIAACLVNPHHIHAFTLPSALGVSEAGTALAHDQQFEALFCSPFEIYYFHPQIGLTVAGMAFFPLFLIGVVSFAAAQWVGRWSWERALVWIAFFALASWRAGAIPFFAVVAGPIASLNILDFAATRLGAAPAATGLADSWATGGRAVVWFLAGVLLLAAAVLGVGGLLIDGYRALTLLAGVLALVAAVLAVAGRARSWAEGGRILTLLAGVLLLVAAVPGWMQSQQPPPWQWRRVGWTVEPDPAMIRVTDRIKEWQAKDGMAHGGRWFNDSPAVLPFLAWYCPGELGCMDVVRLPLYDDKTVQDFKQVRESLGQTKDGDAGKRARNLLRSFDAHFVICYEPFGLGPHSPLPTLLSAPQEWPLLYVDGPASVFGWRDPAKDEPAAPFDRYQVPAEREAFGPLAVPAPAAVEPPAHEWWAVLWTPEAPRPPEADEAAVQLLRFEALQPIWREKNEATWNGLWNELRRGLASDAAREYFSSALSPYGRFQFSFLQAEAIRRQLEMAEPPLPSLPPKEGEEILLDRARKLFDYGSPAPLYLSIRAARRALTVKTDDSELYRSLAEAYFQLMLQTREGDRASMVRYPQCNDSFPVLLRQVQIKTALHHALELDPNNRPALFRSQMLYVQTGFHDVALRNAEQLLHVMADGGADVTELRKEVEGMQKQVQQQQDTYLLKTANKRVAEKVQTAMQMGLGQAALDELLKVDWNAFDDKDPSKLFLEREELSLLLQTGQVDDVAKELKDDEEKLKKGLGFDPTVGLPAYEWLRVETAAAKGDYADADHWLAEIEKQMQDTLALMQRTLTARMIGNVVLRQASSVTSPVWLPVNFGDDIRDSALLEQADNMLLEAQGLVADMEAVRGWLAMEAGNIPQAQAHLDAALKLPRSDDELALDKALRLPPTSEIGFRARPLAELCLEWLKAGK